MREKKERPAIAKGGGVAEIKLKGGVTQTHEEGGTCEEKTDSQRKVARMMKHLCTEKARKEWMGGLRGGGTSSIEGKRKKGHTR